MRSHRPGPHWLLTLFAAVSLLLVGSQAACTHQSRVLEEETTAAHLLTTQPEMILTLTAWPTPPPILTLPATPVAAPQPLWTATPSPATLPIPTPTPRATPLAATSYTAPPPGSNPPPVRIIIPRLEVDAPVIELGWDIVFSEGDWRSEWQTADNSAGHHRDSANPGEAGNVVISGHHNTKGEVFRQVSEIGQPGVTFGQGDEIVLVTDDGNQYTYTVFGWERFQYDGTSQEEQRRQAQYLEQTADATLTLITCWPYESNTHRVVVIAKLQPAD